MLRKMWSGDEVQAWINDHIQPVFDDLQNNAVMKPRSNPRSKAKVVDCWCRTCRPISLSDMRFVVCPDCGNKRCPRANDHRHACTNSNEPGQPGSAY